MKSTFLSTSNTTEMLLQEANKIEKKNNNSVFFMESFDFDSEVKIPIKKYFEVSLLSYL